ncbi:MAG: helix-hairpin-helix domain-containing protein [Capnocytophaga sp.]|nr:helix-hairpin-helix domain-containing protein [Capnocytophaga sp.]
MKYKIKYFSEWKKAQKWGIFGLLVFIFILQLAYFFIDFSGNKQDFSSEEIALFQEKIDSLKNISPIKEEKIYPFNPNYITDYKAYSLGISKEEYDRLLEFRKENKFINSAKQFQEVTHISDSLLEKISPFFKFPDWVTNPKNNFQKNEIKDIPQKKSTNKKDINTATAPELIAVRGIGEKLSERIIKYRERIQGFSMKDQLNEVYGLDNEVIKRIWEEFDILSLPNISKIDINHASKKELSKIPYLSYKDIEEIILYRSEVGTIKDLSELLKINNLDSNKVEKIKLYLSAEFEK